MALKGEEEEAATRLLFVVREYGGCIQVRVGVSPSSPSLPTDPPTDPPKHNVLELLVTTHP